MSQSIKLNNNNYIDSTGITHNRELLSTILNNKIIYDSGSNSNGNWIRFTDGTMIQYGKVEKNVTISTRSSATQWYYDDGYKVNFPKNFISTSYFSTVTNYYGGNITLNVYSLTAQSTSGFEFNLSCSITITNATINFGWFAIGWWK